MKKLSKRLALRTETIRDLQADDLRNVQGGTLGPPTSIIRPTNTSVAPGTTVQSITSGTSIISGH